MDYLIYILVFNIASAVLVFRISGIFKFKTDDYWFYMLNLNLVAALYFVNEYYRIASDYSFVVKFSVILLVVFVTMEIFKKAIVKSIRTAIQKLPKE